MNKNVVITGLGFVTNGGLKREDVWNSICNASDKGLLRDPDRFELPYNLEDKYMGVSPCAQIGVNAANLAWDDSFKTEIDINRDSWGVFVGTAFGGDSSVSGEQCKIISRDGYDGILPMQNMNKGSTMTANIFSIERKLFGPTITFMSGRVASAMALLEAFDEVRFGCLTGMVVVGTEYIDSYLREAYKREPLVGSKSLSSGACAIVIEADEECLKDKKEVKGYLASIEAFAHPGKSLNYAHGLTRSLTYVIEQAILNASMRISDVDLIIYNKLNESVDKLCYQKVFDRLFTQKNLMTPSISSIDIFGDMIGTNSLASVGLGLLYLEKQAIVVNGLLCSRNIENVLVISNDSSGNVCAIILKRYFGQ